MIARIAPIFALVMAATHVAALDLTLPNSAEQTEGQELGQDSYALPIAVFDGDAVPVRRFEGFVQRQSWRIEGDDITPLQILAPLRDQLRGDGYAVVLDCADTECGGFDFRFGTDVIAAPDMLVDLDDFWFLSALKGDDAAPSAAVSLLISRSADAAYVQIIQVTVDKGTDIKVDKGGTVQGSAVQSALISELDKQLEISGHAILSDLVFDTGSASLGAGPFESLEKIAAYLRANPTRRIALVGHTDAVGGLEGNIALSKRRAASVKSRLTDQLGVPDAQLIADGVGFLAPLANNLSQEGRNANRRVEAVLISTQ